MQKPKADKYIEFNLGGAGIIGRPQNVTLFFYTKLNRIVTETIVPFYLLSDINSKDINNMIKSAWSNAVEFTSPNALSQPNNKKVQEIVDAISELLGITKKE